VETLTIHPKWRIPDQGMKRKKTREKAMTNEQFLALPQNLWVESEMI
jgi:hypothetical protein